MQSIPPTIETKRTVLRELRDSDGDRLLERYSEADNSELMLFGPLSTREAAARIVDWARKLAGDKKGLLWGIEHRSTGSLIGILDYLHQDWQDGVPFRSEINYDLSPSFWGNGLTSEAVNASLDYVFRSTRIRRVEASVDTTNYRSVRVLLKNGFCFEGILRGYGCRSGKFYDAAMFAILRDDWTSNDA